MKFSVAVAIAAAAVAKADIGGFPDCAAVTCLLPAIQKVAPECKNPLDFDCVCKHKSELTAEAKPCIEKACSPADVKKALAAADADCAGKGGDDKPTSAAPTESKPAETSSAAPGTESSAAPTETMPTVSGTAPASTDCPQTTMVPTTTPAGNTTAPTSAPVTAGAAGMGSVGAMVAMALGALAL